MKGRVMKGFFIYLKGSVFNIFKGMLMGIANVIPGVSGGTMAVSLGIYDRLIESVTCIIKKFKESISFLFPIFLGMALGIVGFSYLIEYLLREHTLATDLSFVGLILGGLPIIFRGLRGKQKEEGNIKFKVRVRDVVAFILLFLVVIVLPFFKENTDTLQTLDVNFSNAVMLFFGGIIAAATMVIPGVSGSMVMMILGFYYGVLNLVTGFFNAFFSGDIIGALRLCILIIPFGIGVLLGIFIIAKIIDYLFKKHGVITYFAITGLVTASPFAIIYNTGVLGKSVNLIELVVGVVLMVGFATGTYYIGKKK